MANSRYLDAVMDTIFVCPGFRRIRQLIENSTDEVEKAAIVKYVTGKLRDRLNDAKGKK